jgi:cobalt-zinc-cadmium efflux system protein
MRGRDSDLNIRGAFMHMAADALVSAGVVVVGALSLWMAWTWLDPVVSLIIAGGILLGTWGLFKQSLHMLFDGVPDSVDTQAVHEFLLHLAGVSQVNDLHIWAMGTSHIAMTAHLVMPLGNTNDAFLERATEQMHDRFEISHVTLQVMQRAFSAGCVAQTALGH